ncbi:MAG TPA: host attachment family protein [Aestuariivirga sp.]|nr:host attachment protein [Alphaproteobacteria bacterium]HRX35291.1 host attachment family protein [Aestuariivirga sp.]
MKRLVRHARVLVTDGAKALVFRNEGDAQNADLKLVRSYAQDNPPTREQGTDKPGRTNASGGVNRSSMETPDWHQAAEDQFIIGVAEDMNKDLRAGEFETLIVVAPPVALGVYRKAVPAAVAKATLAEIDKDLVKHPPKDIAALVIKVLEGA